MLLVIPTPVSVLRVTAKVEFPDRERRPIAASAKSDERDDCCSANDDEKDSES